MEKKLIAYFFSGTGNSYALAKRAVETFRRDYPGSETVLKSIDRAEPGSDIDLNRECLIGFFMPTHGFTLPYSMLKYLLKMPRSGGGRVFLVATRAGCPIGNLIVPGFEGTANFLSALILKLKGYRIAGMLGADMPPNWLILHSGLKDNSASKVFQKTLPRFDRWFGDVISGKTRIDWDAWLVFLIAVPFIPISVLYMFMGRLFLPYLLFTNTDCNGCGICVRNCPTGSIRIDDKYKTPVWNTRCESCMRCVAYCPKRAIEGNFGILILLVVLFFLPLGQWISSFALSRFPDAGFLSGKGFIMVSHLIAYFLICLLFIGLFRTMIKIPRLNRILAALSPSHYYRRYHYPGVGINQLKRS